MPTYTYLWDYRVIDIEMSIAEKEEFEKQHPDWHRYINTPPSFGNATAIKQEREKT